ncbi:Sensor histidine kinase DesK [Streptomyces sp. YIM 130001]|uniref:sensor histidine kinase n=1 Tax=Streptomyces sp. YIM 130001 TaxID=2259644 RepID=UPI000E6580E2|nr:histidine kinase [Streptomyces sp. YIM 130001]RII17094.1 Sensor histidine kinase DesK [Streptomyces sp. YIM 130001]
MNTSRVRGALLAAVQGLALALLSLGVSLALFIVTVLSMAFIVLGVGVFTTPLVLRMVRTHANHRRLLAASWSDVRIPVPYRKFPADLRTGVTGQVEQCSLLMKDPATWRDMRWLVTDMTGGFVVAILAPGLYAEGVFGLLLMAGLWKPIDGYWYAFIPVDSQGTATLAALLGCVWITLATYLNPYLVKGHFKIAQASLAPGEGAELTQRIDRLTETRNDAVDTSAAELRRIERDLHDGAQARLVSVGMDLGTIEALIEKDPEQAKRLIGQARKSSADALTELRDLVRGIHPPVLAERGVGDAVKALALRMPVPTEVAVDLPGRPDAPVESAAYFAISEVLTNAVKHAGAERIWIDLHHRDGMLRVGVTDDGRGGAAVAPGGGLSGIERRLGTFDGVLAVSSPAGGPTMVTMEIPCELS